jgi:hypothetical protein
MIDRFGVHALDEADVVDDGRQVRKEIAHPRAAVASLSDGRDRRQKLSLGLTGGHRRQSLAHVDRGWQFFSLSVVKLGLTLE